MGAEEPPFSKGMLAQQAGAPELAASSLKVALDADWDDPGCPG